MMRGPDRGGATAPVSGKPDAPGTAAYVRFVLSASGVSIEDIAAAVGRVNSTVTKRRTGIRSRTRSPQWRPRWTPSLATLAVPRAVRLPS